MTLMSVDNNESQDHRSRPRWSANRKIDVVLRLLRGESIEDVSREVGVEVHRLALFPEVGSEDDMSGCGRWLLAIGKSQLAVVGTMEVGEEPMTLVFADEC